MSLRTEKIPVTGSDVISINLSAYPQYTGVYDARPNSQNYPFPYVSKGHHNKVGTVWIKKQADTSSPVLAIQGKSLKYTTAVYLSTTNNVFVSSITGLSLNTLFSAQSGLSALFPAFSGYNINNLSAGGTSATHGFTVMSDTVIEIKLPKLENTGSLDIIVVNPAGYSTLMNSLTTTITIY